MGVDAEVDCSITTLWVTIVSSETGEKLDVLPFTAVCATPIDGKLRSEYRSNRRIVLVRKGQCKGLQEQVPSEYKGMKSYLLVSEKVIGTELWCDFSWFLLGPEKW